MAISPKKKNIRIHTLPSYQYLQISYHRSNVLFCVTICTLCLIVSAFLFFDQIEKTKIYFKYIDTYGKVPDSEDLFFANSQNKNNLYSQTDINTTTTSQEINLLNEEEYKVNAVSILGERNSGTNWIYDHLNECFNHSFPVQRKLTRYKHWFQDEHVGEPVINGTLVLALFRNPFEWVEAMRKKPHHAPEHMFIKDWRVFVSKPWTMKRVGRDLNMTMEERYKKNACQENFTYNDIVSCHIRPYPEGFFKKTHYSEHQPFYEMRDDSSGQPFDNILEMRAAKIRNFLATKDFVGVKDLFILQYERLVESGTQKLVETISELTGAEAKCDFYSPQHRRKRHIDNDLIEYLMAKLDWDAENMVGYFKSGMRNPK